MEGSGSVQIMTDPDLGGPKQTDPQNLVLIIPIKFDQIKSTSVTVNYPTSDGTTTLPPRTVMEGLS
jgi:hypothetical protein